jgi:hypothetical protein
VLSKSNYILYRDCPKNTWLKINKPNIYLKNELSEFEKQIIETGNEVELVARDLFPTGKLIESRNQKAIEDTKTLIADGSPAIFQATFEQDGFFAAVDVLKFNPLTKEYSIYEIKATNGIDKKTHYHDATFQYNLLELSGLSIESVYIIHLNREYVLETELDIVKLFVIEDITETVKLLSDDVLRESKFAQEYLGATHEPAGPCSCIYKGRSGHCTTFQYSNPDVPDYSVHDLSRIGLSRRKLTELVDSHILNLNDISENVELSDIQKNQIWTYKYNTQIVLKDNIFEELEKLTYPLYFLDYETFPAAIPRFDGFSPYDQIPFQYSLHILEDPGSEPKHVDFLYTSSRDPSEAFYLSLASHIGPTGNVIVWHKSFECGRNREIAGRIPASTTFFIDLDRRIYDLEDVFKKQYMVHKDFRGSSSIKKILPVLVPHLSYAHLEIKDGGTAAEAWNRIVTDNISAIEKKKMADSLLNYCKLDTFAMYAIWKELCAIVGINPTSTK